MAGGALSEDFPVHLVDLRPGSAVAGYRLEERVGAGGMAVVFRARDERLGRLVALKILAPALAADQAFRRRFIGESRAAAAVDDPYIIPVYEAGEADGVLFIAMRFVRGGDLRLVLDGEGPLTPGRAAGFISPVASALDAAHRAGLVHRDVKPANILVDARDDRPDHVYLSDFGVSKGVMSSVGLTGTGHFLGTPDYSAPEQIQGHPVDGRTDQYALACVAYQLLTGAVPFVRDQGMAVLLAHLQEPPPSLAARRPGLPAAADEVLARALAKAPEKRYGSCREFADALRAALGLAPYNADGRTPATDTPQARSNPAASGITQPPAARTGSPTAAADAIPVDALTVTAVGPPIADPAAASAPPSEPDPPAAPASLSEPVLTSEPDPATAPALPSEPGQLSEPGLPPEPGSGPAGKPAARIRGHRRLAIALAAVVLAGAGVAAVLLATAPNPPNPSSFRLVATLADPAAGGNVDGVAFSPSGAMLATDDYNGETYLWDTARHTAIVGLADPYGMPVYPVAFSPAGTILAVGDRAGQAYLWNAVKDRLITILAAPTSQDVVSLAFGPGGTTLAFGDYNGSTYLWNVARPSQPTAILTDPNGSGAASVAFSPDGTILAAGDRNGLTYLWNTASHQLITTLSDPGSHGVQALAFSPASTVLATGDANGSTYLWNVASHSRSATLTDPGSNGVTSVAFAPDGAYLATGDANGSTYVWNVASHSRSATLTEAGSTHVASVAFSPDDRTLAIGDQNGKTYLWHET
jgi:serine/threonine-protein kinase